LMSATEDFHLCAESIYMMLSGELSILFKVLAWKKKSSDFWSANLCCTGCIDLDLHKKNEAANQKLRSWVLMEHFFIIVTWSWWKEWVSHAKCFHNSQVDHVKIIIVMVTKH
jgi:hypothetical protein